MTLRGDPRLQLAGVHAKLVGWLVDAAYPLWGRHGVDAQNGGFIEALDPSGAPLEHRRRALVQARQAYAFAQAPRFRWQGDALGIVSRGIDYFHQYYLRPDGLVRTLADAGGAPLDERALLYDQSFALLGYAAAAIALDARVEFERRALELRHAIDRRLRATDDAFFSGEDHALALESNPHMHLLEACLAWAEIGGDPGWTAWVRDLVELALWRFIRTDSGALGEAYTMEWLPAPGVAGRIIEPGHQFEWAWLLLRCKQRHSAPLQHAALRLISIGDEFGVRGGVAINALLDDFSIHDPNARLWPQTERLKAALLAAALTHEPRYWSMAHSAAISLISFIETTVSGLWFDVKLPDGSFVPSPSPASSFYHLVGAIVALDTAVSRRR